MQTRTPDWGGLGSPDAMASLPLHGPAASDRGPANEGSCYRRENLEPCFPPRLHQAFPERDMETGTQGDNNPPIPPGRGPHRPYPCQPRRAAALRPGPPRRGGSGAFLFLSLPSFPPSLPQPAGGDGAGQPLPSRPVPSPSLPFPSLSAAAITGCARAPEAPSLAPPHFPHDPSPASGRAAALGPFSRGLTPSPGDEPLPPVRSPRPVSPRGEE